ncbi:pentapeptide repeat-containing protein [Nocardia asteroides]
MGRLPAGLRSANLQGTNLTRADLTAVFLHGADLRRASLADTLPRRGGVAWRYPVARVVHSATSPRCA